MQTGDVDVMVAIRPNFFYTRTVPCELWFYDRGKPAERQGTVLMLDARQVFRKVTRKIYDFSPEQLADPVSYTHLRVHETVIDLVCRLLLVKKKKNLNSFLLSPLYSLLPPLSFLYPISVSYTHTRAHATVLAIVCCLLLAITNTR